MMKNDLHSNVVVAIRPEVPIIDGMVDIKLLKPHPLNLEAYDFESEESKNEVKTNNEELKAKGKKNGVQLSFFQLDDPVLEQIRDEIKDLDINTLTPIEALMKLNEIKKYVGG